VKILPVLPIDDNTGTPLKDSDLFVTVTERKKVAVPVPFNCNKKIKKLQFYSFNSGLVTTITIQKI
jgi:hypothetical protein